MKNIKKYKAFNYIQLVYSEIDRPFHLMLFTFIPLFILFSPIIFLLSFGRYYFFEDEKLRQEKNDSIIISILLHLYTSYLIIFSLFYSYQALSCGHYLNLREHQKLKNALLYQKSPYLFSYFKEKHLNHIDSSYQKTPGPQVHIYLKKITKGFPLIKKEIISISSEEYFSYLFFYPYPQKITFREDGPAVIFYNDKDQVIKEAWYTSSSGKYHRNSKDPAVILYSQDKENIYLSEQHYYSEGKRHRLEGPAVIIYNKEKKIIDLQWWLEGEKIS